MKAIAITRSDVRVMMASIEAPIVANQTLAAASAIFTWAVKQEIVAVNPCRGVDRNPTSTGSGSCRMPRSRPCGPSWTQP